MGASHQNSSVVDDTDPRFTYSGAWSLTGSASDHNFTSHGTNQTGATAVLSFNGTSVIIYGTVTPTNENGPPVSSYSIDSSPASIYTAPTTNSSLFGLQFFGAEDLTPEVHNLTITVKSANPSEYWVDYALICTDAQRTHSSKSISDMGAMVGGPLGGLALVFFSGLALLWYRRHRQNRGVKIASITHKFDVRPNIDESPAEASLTPLSRSKTLPSISMPKSARVAYSPPGTGSSTSSNPNTPIYGGSGLHANHGLVPQGPYSPPGTGSSTSSHRNTYAGTGLYVSPVVPQGPYSPPGTGDSTSSYPNTPNTTIYGGPGLFASHGLIPIDVSQGQPSPPDPTTPTIANPTPASPSSDQPLNDQGRRTRGKGVPRLATRPTTAPPAVPPVPRLHEDAGIRLEGGRLSDVEAMIDVPPAYREY